MDQRLCRSLVLIASLVGSCGLATNAWARQDAAQVEVEKERAALPHAVVTDVISQTLGEKAPEALRLSATQAADVKKQQAAFEQEVREFLKKGMNQSGDVKVPDRDAAIKKVLAGFNRDQAQALDKALKNTATKRFHEKHSSTTTSPDGKSQTSTSSETSSESSSSHSSQSQHKSDSKHDSKSDRHSEHKSDKQNDSHKSSQNNSDSSKPSDGKKTSWSKMDAKQRDAVVRSLLEELPAKERADLAKELKLEPAATKTK